ncbi:glycohydrolase toxin TNT-related protein [Amycolatopsis roodepoortensis]|uniref:TNT domain-containing protein n=1 Tax=Amycolatopsis roodepoortensis TaxID=700274 RepID=UPI00214C2D39|nr:glycohydrolase toxin TNT-related protein [Amycolatopsis roodepoortensis]UUV35401.1 glycohydrolase toxin TNT-related protein [Amycolatopsis roodepoortensis]
MTVAQPTTQLNATEQDTLVKQIGLALLRAAPRDWRKVTAEYRAVGRYHEMTGEIITEDGTSHEWVATHDIATLFGRLRAGMYRDGRGTWFNARYQLDHPSSYNLEYNRDEPQWRLAPPPQALSDELRMFPRSEENVPEWLIRRMSGLGPEQPGPHFRIARIFDTIGPAGRPVINRPDLEIEEQDRLLEYLDHAPLVVTERGYDIDRLAQTPEATVPVAFHSDGQWIWPAAVNFYLRQYGVSPELDLIEHVRQNDFTLPEVDGPTLQAAAGYLTRGNQPPQQRPNGPGGPNNGAPAGPPPQGPPQNGPVPPQQAAPGQPGPGGPAGPGPNQAVPPPHQQGPDQAAVAAAAAAPVAAAAAVPSAESTVPDQAEQAQRYEDDYDTQDYQAQDFHEAAAEQQYEDGYEEPYASEQDAFTDEERQGTEPEPQLADPEATTYARAPQAGAYEQPPLKEEQDAYARQEEDQPYAPPEEETTTGYTPVEQADAGPELPLLTHDAEPDVAPPPSDTEITQVDGPPQERGTFATAPVPHPEPEPRREEAPPRRAEHPEPVLNELQAKFDELDVPGDVYRIGSPAEHGWSVEQVDGGGWRVGWYDGKLTNPAVFGDAEDAAAFMLGKVLLNPNGAPPPAEEPAAEEEPVEEPAPAPPVMATLSPEIATGSHPVPPRESIPAQEQTAFTTAEELLGDDLDDEPAPAPVPPAPPARPNPVLASPPPAPPRREPPVTPPPAPPMRREEPARPAAAASAGAPDAKQNWPISPLNGEPPLTLFRGKELRELPAGSELDRFGGPNGNLTYAAGTPFEERSLVPEWVNRPYHVYRVQRPLEALAGVAIPWFNQPGGGSAYLLPASIEELLAEGDLIELDPGEPPID